MKTSNSKWENGFWIGLTDMENEGNWTWINNVTEVQQRWEQHQSFLHTFMLNKLIILYIYYQSKALDHVMVLGWWPSTMLLFFLLWLLSDDLMFFMYSSWEVFFLCFLCCVPSYLSVCSICALCHVPMSVSVVQPVGSGFTFRVCVSCLLMLIRISCASCLPFLVVPLCVYL